MSVFNLLYSLSLAFISAVRRFRFGVATLGTCKMPLRSVDSPAQKTAFDAIDRPIN